ncbi:Cytochrome P450 85A1 [Nymphaea thermarum]|nr:Cytochrome P450 85A1 [Nymphaea thermarum]
MADLLVIAALIAAGIVWVTLLKWNEMKHVMKKALLPPGTMGWPLLGETPYFLKYGPDFMKQQRARYGDVFKSHILGCPTIISMDPDLNRLVLTMNERQGLVPGYPQSMAEILGKWDIASVPAPIHKAMRAEICSLTNTNMIRDVLLKDMDCFMRSHLCSWGGKVIDIQDQTKQMSLLLTLRHAAGILPGDPVVSAFCPEFHKLVKGTLSMPINLPCTNYRRALQAKVKIFELLGKIVEERRKPGAEAAGNDILSSIVSKDDKKTKLRLTDDQIVGLLISIIYAGYETVSTTMMMAVKYLHDNPKALRDIKEEQSEIRRKKEPEQSLTWDEYKSMTFTRGVIYETLRLATVVNGVLRKTTRDVELKGFSIPKGWKIFVYMRETNFDPNIYSDPLTFNPWRWQERSLESNPHFMTFGGGTRLCPGKELGTVEIAVFLHYFLTRYRWEEVGEDKILKFPRVEAPNGLRVKVFNC